MELNTLPPHRTTDHKIYICPATKQINVKLNKYPYSNKKKMEKLVTEMLDSGIIRHSQNPVSYPTVFVKIKI